MPMTGRDYKYALQWRFDGQAGENEWTWWDGQDSPNDNPPNWVTEPMLDKVKEFDPKHKTMKLGGQLQKFISEPVVREYKKFRDLLSDEEKTKVIDTIIGREKLDSNTFKTLAIDLTPEQKMDFINKFTRGEVSVSDYKQMEDNLTDSEKVELMANNPHILNNYEVMKKLSDHLSYEQKFNLTGRLDGKKINNTDSKVLLRRWSMTKDQLNQHNETNFYIFLSTPDAYINRLIKVDPLDPSSYRTINMLKLKLESQPDTSLFGIKTNAGMLDDFLEKSSKDIPQETIEYIKNNTSKIG